MMYRAIKVVFSVLLVFFYMSANAAVNSNQALDNFAAHEQRVRNLLFLSGLDKQIDAFPEGIKQGIRLASQSDTSGSSADHVRALNAAVDKTIVPSKFKANISTALFNDLNAKNLKRLFKWYESELGKRITQAEVAASTEEAMQQMMGSISELMSNSERVSIALEIDKAVGATDSAMRIQQNMQVATVIAINKATNPAQSINVEKLKEQIKAQLEGSRANVQQMVVASLLYAYQDISDSDLNKYIEFLKTGSSKKFHSIVIGGIETEMVKASHVMAEAL